MNKKERRLFRLEVAIAIGLILLLWWASGFKVTKLKKEAQRGYTAKNLITLGDAITVYRGDNEGRCPLSLEELIPNYLERIPRAYGDGKVSTDTKTGNSFDGAFDESGGWLYINNPSDRDYCKVFTNF